jgi:hypothetical protein
VSRGEGGSGLGKSTTGPKKKAFSWGDFRCIFHLQVGKTFMAEINGMTLETAA